MDQETLKDNLKAVVLVVLIVAGAIIPIVLFNYYMGKKEENTCEMIKRDKNRTQAVIDRISSPGLASSGERLFYKFKVEGSLYKGKFSDHEVSNGQKIFEEGDTVTVFYSSKNPHYNMFYDLFQAKCD